MLAYGRAAMIRSCARRSFAAATSFMARVIFCVDSTERIRRRMSRSVAIGRYATLMPFAATNSVLASATAFVSDSREFGDVLLNDIPAWWLQAIMPVAFALMALQFVVHAVRRWLSGAAPVEVGP